MRFRNGYMIKKMESKDYSELIDNCERMYYFLNIQPYSKPLDNITDELESFLHDFHPSYDVLALFGPSSICAIALAIIMKISGQAYVAVYTDQEYHYWKVDNRLNWVSLSRVKELANV